MIAAMTGAELQAYVADREAKLEQLRDVLVDDLRLALPREQIQPDTPLFGTGLALDSIDAVDLIVGIERRTGVRIEDDVLVTADGCVVYTSAPKTIDEIEEVMRHE